MTEYRGRFAPSPSGPLHFGSLVAALASWLDARAHQGQWLLRFEDIDSERCDPRYTKVIREQLIEHGMRWDDELPQQSLRLPRYDHYLAQWRHEEQVFHCQCTRRMLSPYRRDGETCYPGTCRNLGLRSPSLGIRFKIPENAKRRFVDRACGPQQQDVSTQCGDFIIRRRNGDYAYQMAVAVDDVEQMISHVVRGQDLLPSTGRQLLLIKAMGGSPPNYLHHRVVLGDDQRKLSKATGAAALATGRALGNLRAALHALGQAPHDEARSVEELLDKATRHWNVPACA